MDYLFFYITASLVTMVTCQQSVEKSVCEQLSTGCKCLHGNKQVVCSNLKGFGSFPRPLPDEIVNLTVTDSDLGDITPRDTNFASLRQLKNIVIQFSQIRYLQTCAISNIQNLMSIRLDYVIINKIATNAFSHLTNIEVIELKNSFVTETFKFSFHDISRVNVFRLFNTSIGKIQTSTFRDFANVTLFEITDSVLTSVENAALQNFSDIQEVKLSGNDIESAFCGLEQIPKPDTRISIEMNDNKWVCANDTAMTLSKLQIQTKDNVCSSQLTQDCPKTSFAKDDHSCLNYRIDQGILAPDLVPYNEEDDKNGSASFPCSVLTLITLIYITRHWIH